MLFLLLQLVYGTKTSVADGGNWFTSGIPFFDWSSDKNITYIKLCSTINQNEKNWTSYIEVRAHKNKSFGTKTS